MDLKEITARYGGTCQKCNGAVNIGDKCFFNPATKEGFCQSCGNKILGKTSVTNAKETAVTDDILWKMNTVIAKFNELSGKVDSLTEKIDKLIPKSKTKK